MIGLKVKVKNNYMFTMLFQQTIRNMVNVKALSQVVQKL